MEDKSLQTFANIIAGSYSNKKQASKNPNYFAHINIYCIPIKWSIFNGFGFYSEQSYDYDPWSPYRQSIQHLFKVNDLFILKNYLPHNPKRLAGAGFHPEFLNEIRLDNLLPRKGCAMYFKKIQETYYQGTIEPGNKCKVLWRGKNTYLKSTVEIYNHKWICLDEGLDIETDKHIWGSEHGPLVFEKNKSESKVQSSKS